MSLKLALIALAFCLTPVAVFAADKPGSADAKPADAGKYYEMRIYTAAPGKADAMNARFRDHTMKLFKKHGIENIAYWTAVDEKNAGKLYYVLAYPDQASRDSMWNAFAKDPEWLKAKEASETNGKLVEKVEQVFMTATDYSPIE